MNEWLGSFFKYELMWMPGNEAFDWNIMKPNQRRLFRSTDSILSICECVCVPVVFWPLL